MNIAQIVTIPANGLRASHVATPPNTPILNANANIIFSLYYYEVNIISNTVLLHNAYFYYCIKNIERAVFNIIKLD